MITLRSLLAGALNPDPKHVRLDPQLCLHSRDRYATCDACFDLCPQSAIVPGKPPVLKTALCKGCLACVPACPTGAIQGKTAVPHLLACARHLEGRTVDLMCEQHPEPHRGTAGCDTGLRVHGCLAGLGSATLYRLAAAGVRTVRLRLDACADCAWGTIAALVRIHCETANALLKIGHRASAVECVDVLGAQQARPFWQAKSPPLSRRDLFKMVAIRHAANQQCRSGRPGPPNRIPASAALDCNAPSGLSMAAVTIADSCTACGACARICPEKALCFEKDIQEKSYRISFDPSRCIDCGACAHACHANAIVRGRRPVAGDLASEAERRCLISGELALCEKCGVRFARQTDSTLCPACAARKQTRFKTGLPNYSF